NAGGRGASPTTGVVGFYKSTDAGEHWHAVVTAASGAGQTKVDGRPLARIGGGDLPTVAVDPKNENVVYTASTVMWRSEDGGANWSAVRGAPGGDDYQKIWINQKIRTSCSSSRIKAAWCQPIAARPGAT